MARQISGPDAMTLGKLRRRGFQIQYLSHAEAILAADFPACLDEIERVLAPLAIPVAELVAGGGGEAKKDDGDVVDAEFTEVKDKK